MIKFETMTGLEVWINPDFIMTFCKANNYFEVQLHNGLIYLVHDNSYLKSYRFETPTSS